MLMKDISAEYTPLVDLNDLMTLGDAARMFGVREKTIIWWLQATNTEVRLKTFGRRKMICVRDLVEALNDKKEERTMIPIADIPEMVTVAEAAKRTNISSYTIRRWANEGEIKFVKSGCKMYIHFQSLVKYLASDKEI